MSSFACENIYQGQERINDELCLTHRGILRTEESSISQCFDLLDVFICL